MATTKATTLAHNIAHSGVTSAVLSAKAPLASPAFTGTPTGLTKAHVGLGNVDNVADASQTSLGTVTSGTIASSATVQQKTALLTGEHTADLNPIADNTAKTLHTFVLNHEIDPYNFITLSTNTVTVTEAGTYDISWHTGSVLVWTETGAGVYMQSYLEIESTDTKKGSTTYVLDHYDRDHNSGTPTFSKGNWVGTLSANNTLKIRGITGALTNGLKGWTGFAGSNNVFSHMLIQKVG